MTVESYSRWLEMFPGRISERMDMTLDLTSVQVTHFLATESDPNDEVSFSITSILEMKHALYHQKYVFIHTKSAWYILVAYNDNEQKFKLFDWNKNLHVVVSYGTLREFDKINTFPVSFPVGKHISTHFLKPRVPVLLMGGFLCLFLVLIVVIAVTRYIRKRKKAQNWA